MSQQTRISHPRPGARCPAFAEVWPVLSEPALDAALAAEARAHLAGCAYCQAQLADYERLDLTIQRYLGPAAAPRYRTEAIMKDILAGAEEQPAASPVSMPVPAAAPPRLGRARRFVSGLAALAAVLVIVVLAATLFAHFAPRHRATTVTGKSTPTPALVKGSQWWLWDIAMVSAADGWAVGNASPPDSKGGDLTRPLLMHYQHGTWSSETLTMQGWLNSISMVSATDGWAVGHSNQVGALILHYDGQRWRQVVVSARGDYLRARVQMLSASEGWIAGEDSILHYDGHAWQPQALPASLGAGKINSISLLGLSMLSPVEGWAVGNIFPILTTPPPEGSDAALPDSIILHYTGGQWTVQQILHHVTLNGVAMLAAGDGWITGRTEAFTTQNGQRVGTLAPLLLRYAGGQWVEASQPLANTYGELKQVVMLSPTDGWITTSEAQLLHYNGTVWSKVALPKAPTKNGYDLPALSMLSASEGWAAGSLVSDRDGGIPDPTGGYEPTTSPIFLHYLNGVWSIFGG